MKVICVTNGWMNRSGSTLCPSYGDICTVISETEDGVAYVLKEFPHENEPVSGWHKIGFIPLSEIDETEMERNYSLTNTEMAFNPNSNSNI